MYQYESMNVNKRNENMHDAFPQASGSW